MTTQERIERAAVENGWTRATNKPVEGACEVTYRKGVRYVRIEYGVRGQVIYAAYQTGGVGGRGLSGAGKAEKLVELLGQPRWTR